ncbi:DUF4160 domain-containing protein [Azospirillum sp. Sh1]|nr:DUF4160 domain-containing protein [Azospirillum sp. Sh1]
MTLRDKGSQTFSMPIIVRIGNARVYIYADDHNPPHFHIVGPDFNALVRINDLVLLKGTAPPDTMRKVLEWAGENRPLLALRWIEINGEE